MAKASQIIEQLIKLIAEHGDLDFELIDDDDVIKHEPAWAIEWPGGMVEEIPERFTIE